jgi:hypothetical protein
MLLPDVGSGNLILSVFGNSENYVVYKKGISLLANLFETALDSGGDVWQLKAGIQTDVLVHSLCTVSLNRILQPENAQDEIDPFP